MVGCLILGFVRQEVSHRIKRVDKCRVKTGMKGKTGNKGAVLLRFNFDDTSFVFAAAHLESGQGKSKIRVQQIDDIMD